MAHTIMVLEALGSHFLYKEYRKKETIFYMKQVVARNAFEAEALAVIEALQNALDFGDDFPFVYCDCKQLPVCVKGPEFIKDEHNKKLVRILLLFAQFSSWDIQFFYRERNFVADLLATSVVLNDEECRRVNSFPKSTLIWYFKKYLNTITVVLRWDGQVELCKKIKLGHLIIGRLSDPSTTALWSNDRDLSPMLCLSIKSGYVPPYIDK